MNAKPPFLNFLISALTTAFSRARDELRVWAAPRANPFLGQARAGETRRPTLWRALLTVVALWVLGLSISGLAFPRADLDATRADLAGDAALLWIGATLIVAFGTRVARCIGLLRVEVIKNRFEPLQLLPLSSARRAWLWCAPVSVFAYTICLLAWPALAWELGSQRFAAHDALGLGFLALVFGWGTPLWKPDAWRAQIGKTGALHASQSDGFAPPPTPIVPNQSALSFWSSGAVLVIVALTLAGVLAEAPATYWHALPAYVRDSADRLWLSWPLFGARWLTEAQPFFGFSIAPMLILAPVWVAGVHNTILRLGAVTAREPYWTRALLHNWRRAGRVQSWGLLLFICGVLWAGAIEGAWLSQWFAGAPTSIDWALAAWWLVALFVGALSAASRWKQTLAESTEAVPLSVQLRHAAREARRAVAWVAIMFFGALVLGWNWPFGAPWRQILPASLAVAGVWLGAATVTAAAQQLPRAARAFAWIKSLWFYGGPLLYLALFYLEIDLRPLTPQLYLLSPWSLWWSLRQPTIASFPLFWPAIAAHCSLIAAVAIWVWRGRATSIGDAEREEFSSANSTADSPAVPGDSSIEVGDKFDDDKDELDDEEDDFDDDELEDHDESAPAASVLRRANLLAPDARLCRVLSWLARFNNPLLQLETRRVIGNGLSGTLEMALLLSGALAFFLMIVLPVWGLYNGGFPAEFAMFSLAIALLIWCVVPLNGIEGAARCYDHDRVDGSLPMLFLTPMTEPQIALGKLGPFLARAALLLAFYSPLWLLGLVPALLFREPIIVAVYLSAPLFATSFAVRIAAISHWTALKKRDIGKFGVPAIIVLSALVAIPAEATALFAGLDKGALSLSLILAGLSLVFALEAALFWWLGLRQLRWRRFLDAPKSR